MAREQVEQLLAGGLKVISCGANVPFADPEIFFGPTGEFADQHTAVIPDFIANCGMARVFAYLMETGAEITDQAIFADTSRIIGPRWSAPTKKTRRPRASPSARSRWPCGSWCKGIVGTCGKCGKVRMRSL